MGDAPLIRGFATFTDDDGTALADYTPERGPVLGGGVNWDIQTNKARNSPTAGAAIVGGDTLNGNMETGDPPTGWNANNATLDGVADERTGGAGSQSINIAAIVAEGDARRNINIVNGTWYLATSWLKMTVGAGYIRYGIDGVTNFPRTFAETWIYGATTWRSIVAGAQTLKVFLSTTGDEGRADDLTLAPLTLSDLISGADYGYSDVLVNADLAVTADTHAGVVACLDSLGTPANFLLAHHNGTNATLLKCVAGTYTSLISAAATYVANAPIRIIKDGTTVTLFYNSVAVGTPQTVSDAGIISNTIHGIFSTFVDNRADNFEVKTR